MYRSTRSTASLLRSLLVGSALALSVSTTLVGCADESKPEYWVEKLEDKPWRARSIEKLTQMFEDAMTTSKKDMKSPEVQEFLKVALEPLTKTYVDEYANLDEKTRQTLMELIASFRDERTEPALKKAFDEFAARGRGGKDVKFASRAVRDMKLKSLAPSVLGAFKKTKPSTKEGAYYRDLNEALTVVADPSWVGELVPLLDEDFPIPPKGKNLTPEQVSEKKDKIYQTITAAQLLGELGAEAAVRPLIKVILDPTKADAANECLLALTKIGKPAIDAAVKLLKDDDKELVEFQKRQIQKVTHADKPPEGSPHLEAAATIVGALGRTEGIKPMLEVIESKKEEEEKLLFYVRLGMLPHTDEVKKAFTGFLSDVSADTRGGLQAMATASTSFFDPDLASLLVKRAGDVKDDPITKLSMALAAVKLMDASNSKSVMRLVDSVKKEAAKDEELKKHVDKFAKGAELAEKVMETCKKDVSCYLKEAQKSDNQSEQNQLAAVKALYMVGIHGGPNNANDLIDAMPGLLKGELRQIAADAIDHHHPKGSEDIAKKLEAIVEKDKNSMDKDKAMAVKPLRDVMYRLRARG